jgi:thiol-disulfide isomerase/thioredoxin
MDRLSALILCVALLAGCDDTPAAPAPSRVVAVQATETRTDPRTDLCEVVKDGADAPLLALPPLAEGQTPPASTGKRWLNVWATWCRPCVEEMPALVGLRDRMRQDGAPFELVFVSVDETEEAVDTFRQAHPEVPESLRTADPSALSTWVTSVGLDEGATLPIHVLTDPTGHVRCARTGGLSERDLALAEEALRAL